MRILSGSGRQIQACLCSTSSKSIRAHLFRSTAQRDAFWRSRVSKKCHEEPQKALRKEKRLIDRCILYCVFLLTEEKINVFLLFPMVFPGIFFYKKQIKTLFQTLPHRCEFEKLPSKPWTTIDYSRRMQNLRMSLKKCPWNDARKKCSEKAVTSGEGVGKGDGFRWLWFCLRRFDIFSLSNSF